MLLADKKITVQDYRLMEFEGEDAYYELINGIIVRKASPNPYHQEISQNLNIPLSLFVRNNRLGKVFTAPTDVFLNDFNHHIPDLFFVRQDNLGIVDYKNGIFGVPDLIVEIISPGSILNDRVDKRIAYEQAGVREYWLIDPNNRSIEVYENQSGTFAPVSFAAESGKVQSRLLAGFETDLDDVFPR
jgi:Uma2 family endonuclease